MNNTITEMKTTQEGINSRITEAEERISDLEDRMVEFTVAEQNKDADIENGLEDTGKGKGKLGRSERVALTYLHYQM